MSYPNYQILFLSTDEIVRKISIKADVIKGFPNGPGFRYGNFFIPRVEKTSKN